MTLVTILIVLFIDRLVWQGDALRQHRWFDRYTDRLLASATGQWLAKQRQGALWLLLPALLLVILAQWLVGDTVGLVLGTVVLLFALGPRDLGRASDAYLSASAQDEDDEAQREAESLAGDQAPEGEPERSLAVAEGLLRACAPRLFAPIFWFVVLGPMGAALYRLGVLVHERSAGHAQAPAGLPTSARRLLDLLDWLPARLTAASFAAAGSFDAVSRAWRSHEGPTDDQRDSDLLLTATGRAALDSWPDKEEIAAGEQAPVIEDAMALIWRSLIVWLLALTTLTLLAALL